jgi:uncharacterized repeat protein (TIGR02543 family)
MSAGMKNKEFAMELKRSFALWKRNLYLLIFAAVFLLITGCPSSVGDEDFTVKFNTLDGSVIPSQSVPGGGKVKEPVEPVKEGFIFGGWYREEACENVWNLSSDTVTGNITLYAKWVEEGDFVPVSNITNVPEGGVAGSPVSFAGAKVEPETATFKEISWRVTTAGAGLALGVINGNSFTPTAEGQVKLTAYILHGNEDGGIYSQEFTLDIALTFVAVTAIEGSPLNAVTGSAADLNAGLTVQPGTATHKSIVWSVKSAGDTGLTNDTVASGVFTPEQAGTATLIATILNGRGEGDDYTQEFTLTIITPVTSITGVPTAGTKGYVVDLSGASVEPSEATNKTIEWSVKDAGDTGVTAIADKKFTPAATGTLELTASIANGSAVGTPFTREYTITIHEPGEFNPEFGLVDDTSILLRGNKDGSDQGQLSRDTVIEIAKDSVYYVSLITSGGNYTDVVWQLNGVTQTIGGSGSLIYLNTSTIRPVKLAVIAKRGGSVEGSGIYTFTIK